MKLTATVRELFSKLFVWLLCAEILVYFINSDMYFQLSGSYLFLVAALGVGAITLLMSIKRIKLNVYHAMLLVFLLCALCSLLVNSKATESGYILSYTLFFGVILIFASLEIEKKDMEKIYFAYILLGLIISALIIIFEKRYYADESNRITIQLSSSYPLVDPNYLGACLSGSAMVAFMQAMRKTSESGIFKKKDSSREVKGSDRAWAVAYWIAFAVVAFGTFRTGSRGALLSLGAGVAIVFCVKYFKNFTLKKAVWLFVIGSCAAILAVNIIPQAYFDRLFRIENWLDPSNVKRLSLWANAFAKATESPLFGYGIGNTSALIGSAAHNTYLELLIHFGFVGAAALIILVIGLLVKKGNVYRTALIASTIVWSIFISAEMTLFFWLNIVICIWMTKNEAADAALSVRVDENE